jgi:hypothetical protein
MNKERINLNLDRCMAIAASIETVSTLVKHSDLDSFEEESTEGIRNIVTVFQLLSDGLFECLETVRSDVVHSATVQDGR